MISIKLQLCNFIEITFRHGCSPVNLLHILRTLFPQEHLCRATSELRLTCIGLKNELEEYNSDGLQVMVREAKTPDSTGRTRHTIL